MTTVFTLADIVIDLDSRTVARGKNTIRLPELSFGVLSALVTSAPKSLSVQDLAKQVWLSGHVSDETVAQRIRLLRKSLGDEVADPKYIKTVRSAGYACAQPVCKAQQNIPANLDFHWLKKAKLPAVVIGICSILAIWLWQPKNEIKNSFEQPTTLVDGLVDRALIQLGVQQADETDRAIKLLRRAYAEDSNNPAVQIALSFALSTRVTKFRPHPEDVYQAEELAREGLRNSHAVANAWHALGYALDAQGRVDEALSCYEQAYEIDNQDTAAMSSAAYLLAIRGRLFDALILNSRVMKSSSSSRYTEIQLASVLDLIGHVGAATWRERAQVLNPDQVVVIAEVAQAYLRRGLPEDTLDVLALAAEEFDTSPRLLHLRGRAYFSLGDSQKAITNLARAGDRAATDIAAIEFLNGSTTHAHSQIKIMGQKMIGGDSWPRLRIHLAELTATIGDDESALKLISQAIDLGWRDALSLENSPFLARALKHEDWIPIQQRIAREVAMQKSLIEQSTELAWIIKGVGVKGQSKPPASGGLL